MCEFKKKYGITTKSFPIYFNLNYLFLQKNVSTSKLNKKVAQKRYFEQLYIFLFFNYQIILNPVYFRSTSGTIIPSSV